MSSPRSESRAREEVRARGGGRNRQRGGRKDLEGGDVGTEGETRVVRGRVRGGGRAWGVRGWDGRRGGCAWGMLTVENGGEGGYMTFGLKVWNRTWTEAGDIGRFD